MTSAFVYRPKFVDVRVKKPKAEKAAAATNECVCDQVGCGDPGACRAPKGRGRLSEYWWFCPTHAAEYNRRWNYFEGMSDADWRQYEKSEEVGHRPTWSFRPSRQSREFAAMRHFQTGQAQDRFGLFRGQRGGRAQPAPEPRKHFSRLEKLALEALALDEEATPEAIRARYAELVKRYHPDSNGGDRSTETLLEKAVKAYQVLKQGGHA